MKWLESRARAHRAQSDQWRAGSRTKPLGSYDGVQLDMMNLVADFIAIVSADRPCNDKQQRSSRTKTAPMMTFPILLILKYLLFIDPCDTSIAHHQCRASCALWNVNFDLFDGLAGSEFQLFSYSMSIIADCLSVSKRLPTPFSYTPHILYLPCCVFVCVTNEYRSDAQRAPK